jgi:transposase InsO family protein
VNRLCRAAGISRAGYYRFRQRGKRKQRLLRVNNLLCARRRKFLLGTTDSRHGWPIYPNLAAGMVLTSIDQVWVADITCIRLQWEFVYVAVVLDVVLGGLSSGTARHTYGRECFGTTRLRDRHR